MILSSKLLYRIAITLLLCVAFAVVAQSCPNCKDGFTSGSEQAKIGESYSESVLFMLIMIFSVFGGGALLVARQIRNHKRKQLHLQPR